MATGVQLKFTYVDALNKSYTENLGYVDKNKFDANAYSSDTEVRQAFLSAVDSGCRAIAALTTNTYNGAEFISTIDINEELVPGGD